MNALWWHFDLTKWIWTSDITEQEKEENPKHTTTDGYLKKYTYHEAFKNALDKLSVDEIKAIKTIKNFDAEIFEEISGVKI